MTAAKLVICNRRFEGRERKVLQRAWTEEVGPATMALRGTLGFERYAQLHCVARGHPLRRVLTTSRSRPVSALVALTTDRGSAPGKHDTQAQDEPWMVLDELWWPSLDALLDATTSPAGLEALSLLAGQRASRADAAAAVVCRELVIGAPRAEVRDATRVTFCLRPQVNDPPERAQQYWRESHAALVRRLSGSMGFDQYDQAHAVLDDPRVDTVEHALVGAQPSPYMGFASLSFPTVRALALRIARPSGQIANFRLMRDELAFIDPLASPPVIGTRIPFC